MQLNKREERNERSDIIFPFSFYRRLSTTALVATDAIFSLCVLPPQKLSLTRPTRIPRFTATTPLHKASATAAFWRRRICMCVCIVARACANIFPALDIATLKTVAVSQTAIPTRNIDFAPGEVPNVYRDVVISIDTRFKLLRDFFGWSLSSNDIKWVFSRNINLYDVLFIYRKCGKYRKSRKCRKLISFLKIE